MDWIGFLSRRVWLGTNVYSIHVGSGRLGIGSGCGRLRLGSGLRRGLGGLGPIADRGFGSEQVWVQSTSSRVGFVLGRSAVGWVAARI
jgi:hypothetical protein